MVRIIKCQECGNDFKAYDNKARKYCSLVCKKEATRRMNRWNKKVWRERHSKDTKVEEKQNKVADVTKTAREHGMSYGQWVALEYAKQVKVGAR